ncbi:MAG: response regulator [Candidatus Aegiribacteria sp.]
MKDTESILIIDDEQDMLNLIRELLEGFGYAVEEACNGSEALRKASEKPFSIVLIDVMMPDINGLELASILMDKFPDSFVILMTGYGSIDLAKDAIQRGAFDFITKPFSRDELRKTMERAVEIRKRKLSELPSPELTDLYNMIVDVKISDSSYHVYLNSLSAIIRKTFRGDACRLYLTDDPVKKEMSKAAGSGNESLLEEEKWEKIVRASLKSSRGLVDDARTGDLITGDLGVSSVMTAPIPSSDRNTGTIVVARTVNPFPFTPRDHKLLNLFAAQAGKQIVNHRMTSDLENKASILENINLLAGNFSSLSLKKSLSAVCIGLRSMVQFDFFGVMLRGENMLPFSYVMARSDLPMEVLQKSFKKKLERMQSITDVNHLLMTGEVDSFASLSRSDWDSAPNMETVDLGDIGSLSGMIVLASWNPSVKPFRESSHVHLLLRHAAAALSNAYLFESSERSYIQTIAALAEAVDAKDTYTHNHSRNVAAYATIIGSRLDLTSKEISRLNYGALLHDIGKIGIPEAVLNKAGPLTDEEFELIRSHPEMGYNILKPITAFSGFLDAVRYHHERIDGTGYPHGLSGNDIPFQARILAAADAFDAMVSDRVYRKSPGLEYAVMELHSNLGSQFDRDIGRVFISVLESSSPAEIISNHQYGSLSQPV